MEWLIPDPSLPIRQGDVLISRQPKSGEIQEIFLVITADCDISKDKFGSQLACLRILTHHTYIKSIWGERKFEAYLTLEQEKIRAQIAKWHKIKLNAESTLTTDTTVTWVRHEAPEIICDALDIPEKDRKKITKAIKVFCSLMDAVDDGTNTSPLSKYVAIRAVSKEQDVTISKQEVLAQAQNEPLPDDVFLLPGLPQVDGGAVVILLRELVGIPHEAIVSRVTEAPSIDKFLRIGRMQPTFKYAVSQAFGALYSRIGLPDEYEKRCKGAIQDISKFSWEDQC